MHQYAGQAHVTHCRYAVLTGDLAQWIATFGRWADWGTGTGPYEVAWGELPLFFQWLRSQMYADPTRDLAKHRERICGLNYKRTPSRPQLQYLPFLLSRAAPDAALISYLTDINTCKTGMLDPIRAIELPRLAWAEDKVRAGGAGGGCIFGALSGGGEWEWEWGEDERGGAVVGGRAVYCTVAPVVGCVSLRTLLSSVACYL